MRNFEDSWHRRRLCRLFRAQNPVEALIIGGARKKIHGTRWFFRFVREYCRSRNHGRKEPAGTPAVLSVAPLWFCRIVRGQMRRQFAHHKFLQHIDGGSSANSYECIFEC